MTVMFNEQPLKLAKYLGEIPVYPALPEDMSKSGLLKLALDYATLIKIGDKPLQVLRRLFEKIPLADFQNSSREPICYEKQFQIAASLGMPLSTYQTAEYKLVQNGLIEDNTPLNGYRGMSRTGKAHGLSLSPLIEMIQEMQRLTGQSQDEENIKSSLRIEIAILRREVVRKAEGHKLELDVTAKRSTWKRPSRMSTSKALLEHLQELEKLLEQLVENTPRTEESMSAYTESGVRHIQTTLNNNIESCNETPSQMDDCKQSKPYCASNDAEICLENAKVEICEEEQTFLSNLTLPQVIALSGPDMRDYLTAVAQPNMPVTSAVLDRAATLLAMDHAVNPTLWERCIEEMGFSRAVLALVILDRNRDHPTHPVRNLPAALNHFLQLDRKGELSLRRSVFGIWKRENEAPSDGMCKIGQN